MGRTDLAAAGWSCSDCPCTIHEALGLCPRCYGRRRYQGTLPDPTTITVVERFMAKIEPVDEGGCLPWGAGIATNGYGKFWIDGRTMGAHVAAWFLAFDVWPDGQLDHTCHNLAAARGECTDGPTCRHRRCVNVVHLRDVTSAENTLSSVINPAAINAAKTHCGVCGGPYVHRNGQRKCLNCGRTNMRRYRSATTLEGVVQGG